MEQLSFSAWMKCQSLLNRSADGYFSLSELSREVIDDAVNRYLDYIKSFEVSNGIAKIEIIRRDDTIKKLVSILRQLPIALNNDLNLYLLELDTFYLTKN